MSTRFLMFSMVLPNTELFMSLKKVILKLILEDVRNLIFLSIHFFKQSLSSNLNPRWIFINFNPKLNIALNFRNELYNPFYFLSLVLIFSPPAFNRSGAKEKSLCKWRRFLGFSKSTSNIHGIFFPIFQFLFIHPLETVRGEWFAHFPRIKTASIYIQKILRGFV